MVHKGGALDPALDRLEALCDGAAHLVGHNILRHDLPHLVANRARLADGRCFVVNFGRGRGLGHAAVGADAVPAGGADHAASAGYQLQRS